MTAWRKAAFRHSAHLQFPRRWYAFAVQTGEIKSVIGGVWNDIRNNHLMAMAAALAYYLVLSLFPALIVVATVVAFLPIPNLFDQILTVVGRAIPADSMGMVRRILTHVMNARQGGLLSIGVLGTLWSISSGFTMMIEALNVAYNVPETRPMWRTRLLSVYLALVTGTLLTVSLGVMLVGPHFGAWLTEHTSLGRYFAIIWPYLQWTVSTLFTVVSVEAIYFLAPNVKQRFTSTLPGATFAIVAWLALSYALGLYFRSFANFKATYGVLGGAICMMVWFYWTALAMLIGAELNWEILQVRGETRLPLKEPLMAKATGGSDVA